MDSFIFLFLENYGVRKLEALFAVLIATMGVSFAWMFGETKPSGKDLLMGKKVYLIGYLLFVLKVLSLVGTVAVTELDPPCRYFGAKTQLKNN